MDTEARDRFDAMLRDLLLEQVMRKDMSLEEIEDSLRCWADWFKHMQDLGEV